MLQMQHCNNNVVSRMAETPLFSNLSESERRVLQEVLDVRIRSYAKGEMIVNECDPADDVFVVLKGSVSVYECLAESDRRHLVCRLHPGETYGASFPALNLKLSPGMLVANGSVEMMLCRTARVRSLLRRGEHSGFIVNLYAAAARQGFNAWRKLTLVSCYKNADRLKLYLRWRREEGLDGSKLPSAARLAEYLGVNRTALYRDLAKLRKR